jgi:hypothetical protein
MAGWTETYDATAFSAERAADLVVGFVNDIAEDDLGVELVELGFAFQEENAEFGRFSLEVRGWKGCRRPANPRPSATFEPVRIKKSRSRNRDSAIRC